jgi:hypothetical protein
MVSYPQVQDELGELHDFDTAMLGMGFGVAMGLKVIEAYRKVCKKQAKEEARRKRLHDAELEDMRKKGVRRVCLFGKKMKKGSTSVVEERRYTKSERDTDVILGTVVNVAKHKTIFIKPLYYPVHKEESQQQNTHHIHSSEFNGESEFITQSRLTHSHSHRRKSPSPEGRGRSRIRKEKHKKSRSKGRKSFSPEANQTLSYVKNTPSRTTLVGFSQFTALEPSQIKMSHSKVLPSSGNHTPSASKLDAFSQVEASRSKHSLGRHSPTRVNPNKIETKRPLL